MLLSTDGGDTWVARGSSTFLRAAFSSIAVDPDASQHLVAATDQGVYESTNEGVDWTPVAAGISHDLVVDWTNPGGTAIYVGVTGVGIRRRVGNGEWTTLTGCLPPVVDRVALAMAPSNPRALWAAIPSGDEGTVYFYRTDDGGTTWTAAAGTVAGKQLGYSATAPGGCPATRTSPTAANTTWRCGTVSITTSNFCNERTRTESSAPVGWPTNAGPPLPANSAHGHRWAGTTCRSCAPHLLPR